MGRGWAAFVPLALLVVVLAGCTEATPQEDPPVEPRVSEGSPSREEPTVAPAPSNKTGMTGPRTQEPVETSDRYYILGEGQVALANPEWDEPARLPFDGPIWYPNGDPVPTWNAGRPVYEFTRPHRVTQAEATVWIRSTTPTLNAALSHPDEENHCAIHFRLAFGGENGNGNGRQIACADIVDSVLTSGEQRFMFTFPSFNQYISPGDRMYLQVSTTLSSSTGKPFEPVEILGGTHAFNSHIRLIGAEEPIAGQDADPPGQQAAPPPSIPAKPEPQDDPGPHSQTPGTPSVPQDGPVKVGLIVLVSLLTAFGRIAYKAGRYKLLKWLFIGFLFTRIQRDSVLDHKRRAAIFRLVTASPGVTFGTLRRDLHTGSGALVHHLRILEKQGFIRCVRDGFRSRFYPRGAKVPQESYLSLTQESLLVIVENNPGIAQKHLAKVAGLPRQTLHYHMRNLQRIGKIRVRRDGRFMRHYRA